MRKIGNPAILLFARPPWGLISLLGSIFLLGGILFLRKDISSMAGFFSQTGSGNPRIVGRVNELPFVLLLTGIEMIVLGYCGRQLRISLRSDSTGNQNRWGSKDNIMGVLMGLYTLIAAFTLNLSVLTVGGHLWSPLNDAEKIKNDFGEAYGVIEAVRRQTPSDASILIKTRQPLKYLLNYELYPRRFYFHHNPSLNVSEIPSNWMNRHKIDWILYIADDEPLRFSLSKLKATE